MKRDRSQREKETVREVEKERERETSTLKERGEMVDKREKERL